MPESRGRRRDGSKEECTGGGDGGDLAMVAAKNGVALQQAEQRNLRTTAPEYQTGITLVYRNCY